MTDPGLRALVLSEGRKQADAHGVPEERVSTYARGWLHAMEVSQERAAELERELSLTRRELERQRDQVLAYVAKLECTNCEHVHEEGDCGATIPDGRACRCTWGPPQVADDIRDLLKEKPDADHE
jgi:hypothetical protein